MTRRKDYDETALIRALVALLDADHVRALGIACETTSSVLAQVDRRFPDPDKRWMVARLITLGETMNRANQARDFIEGSER